MRSRRVGVFGLSNATSEPEVAEAGRVSGLCGVRGRNKDEDEDELSRGDDALAVP